MASYYTELGLKEEETGRNSTPVQHNRLGGGRWVNQTMDDFMAMESNRPTPVSAMASPERFLSVARLYSDYVGDETDTGHQQFLESLIMQLYEEANAASTGPPPASREFIRTLPVVTHKESEPISCTICNEDAFANSSDTSAHEDSVTRLPCKHYYHREC
ncbi:hypothetical protein GGI22_006486, partial [Coemansia erecta]